MPADSGGRRRERERIMEDKPKKLISKVLDVVLPFVLAALALMAAVKGIYTFSLVKLFASGNTAVMISRGIFLVIAVMLLILGVVSVRRALDARKS